MNTFTYNPKTKKTTPVGFTNTPASVKEWDDLYARSGDLLKQNPPAGVPLHKHFNDAAEHRDAVSRVGMRVFGIKFSDHDQSKFSANEMLGYSLQFFTDCKGTQLWKDALAHHYKCNPHHPEHWQGNVNEAPEIYRQEAFCDIVACVYARKGKPHFGNFTGAVKSLKKEWQDKSVANNARFGNWIKDFVRYADKALDVGETNIQTSWSCKPCNMTMKTGAAYKKHMAASHKGSPCAYCGETEKHDAECTVELIYQCNECAFSSQNPTACLNKAKQDHGPTATIRAVKPVTIAQSLPGGTTPGETLNSSVAPPKEAMGTTQTLATLNQALVGTMDNLRDHAHRWAEVSRVTVTDTDTPGTLLFSTRWSDRNYWSSAANYIAAAHTYGTGSVYYRIVFFGASNKTGSALIGTRPHAAVEASAGNIDELRTWGDWQSHTFTAQTYTDYSLRPQADVMGALPLGTSTGPELQVYLEQPVANTLGTGATQIDMQIQFRLGEDFVFSVPVSNLPLIQVAAVNSHDVTLEQILIGRDTPGLALGERVKASLTGGSYFPTRLGYKGTNEVLPPTDCTLRPWSGTGAELDRTNQPQLRIALGSHGMVPAVVDGELSDNETAYYFFYGDADADKEEILNVKRGELIDDAAYEARWRVPISGKEGSHMLITTGPFGVTYFVYVRPEFFTPDTAVSSDTASAQWNAFFAGITYEVSGVPAFGAFTSSTMPGDAKKVLFSRTDGISPTFDTDITGIGWAPKSAVHDKMTSYFRGRFPVTSVSFNLKSGSSTFPLKWNADIGEFSMNTSLFYAHVRIQLDSKLSAFTPINASSSGLRASARHFTNQLKTQAQASFGAVAALLGLQSAANMADTSVSGGFQLAGQKRHHNFIAEQNALSRQMVKDSLDDIQKFKMNTLLATNQAYAASNNPAAAGGNAGRGAPPPDLGPDTAPLTAKSKGYRMLTKGIGKGADIKHFRPTTDIGPTVGEMAARHAEFYDPEVAFSYYKAKRDAPAIKPVAFQKGETLAATGVPRQTPEQNLRNFNALSPVLEDSADNLNKTAVMPGNASLMGEGEKNVNELDTASNFEFAMPGAGKVDASALAPLDNPSLDTVANAGSDTASLASVETTKSSSSA